MNATIITVGDEILIGQIVDTNSAWLGNELTLLGIDVKRILSIPDKEADIHKALDLARLDSDLILMTGGLGPTKDDITKKALAAYVGSEFYFDQPLADRIAAFFERRGIPFLEAHRQQCYMPRAATSLKNEMGTAPGMLFQKDGKLLLSMPGVPYEMKWIFSNSFLPELAKLRKPDSHIYHRTIKTVGMGESRIAESIHDILDTFPPYISMSFLPSLGSVKLRLTAKHAEDKSAEVESLVIKIAEKIPKLIYGYDFTTIGEALRDVFVEKNLKLSTAESCTGGYLAHQLTTVPGSSKFYHGSIIAYDYAPKKSLLGVSPATLENHGAVSEETVKEMLSGVLEKFGTDLGVAISGIAGPGGGMPDKPVGTIWMAYGTKEDIRTYKLQLTKDRLKNIQYTSMAAMNALRKFVLGF